MNALAWSILLIEVGPYAILAGSLVIAVIIYKLWRSE